MGVLLQGFFKLAQNVAAPSPADGDGSIPWWWDHLAAQANAFRSAGFTAVWLPPALKTAGGSQRSADGYGPFDDYDIGSRNQKGSLATRFGTREELQRCVAVMRANGLDVYLDMIEHHRSGDPGNFIFRYPGADGTPDIGRFPKNPGNFLPQVPRDPNLGGSPKDDAPFGRELAPINGRPPHYVSDNLIAACDWLTRALDTQGYRLDDVKGLSTDFLFPFLNARSMAGKFAVGEFFDGNRVLVNGWIFNPRGMRGRPSAFDFPLKFVLTSMCNNPGMFNMSDLDHTGLIGISPLNAVTFVENHDTDLNVGQKIVVNKLLGYAYILTSEGYPCVFYRDYSTDKNCYGLKPFIDNLIWIHEKLAAGPTLQRFKTMDVFAYERLGGAGLLVGLNNDPNNPQSITVSTNFGSRVTLHDYTGNAGNVMTDGNGMANITIPRNNNGHGYVCFSRDGLGGGFAIQSQPVTQDFEGAADLDILPAIGGKAVTVGRVWCAANAPIHLTLTPDMTAWSDATAIVVDVLSPGGAVRASQRFTLGTLGAKLQTTAQEEGFHTLRLTASSTPPTSPNPSYKLSVTYTATQTLPVAPPVAEDTSRLGQWGPKITLPNVPIHSHLLPNGKVLFWGRRKQPTDNSFASLNEWETHAFLLDLTTLKCSATSNQPLDKDGKTINLFCSGHTFLADGRLMVVGGHLFDSQGHNAATIYDFATDQWTAAAPMANGRWYPSAVTLADGSVMVCSGTFANGTPAPAPHAPGTLHNNTPEIWNGADWKPLSDFSDQTDEQSFLYPRFHLAPDGRVLMSGAAQDSFFFDATGEGKWTLAPSRSAGAREYAPSVMYDAGKIAYFGGGNAPDAAKAPTNIVEAIDLDANPQKWTPSAPMNFARRQHNATLLPDGTVLITGGTQGGAGAGGQGFNDLSPGKPVHAAELWDPQSKTWTLLAEEDVDRCYHSTAVLLPDGRVLSAGGGEYQPDGNILASNDPNDSHLNAQIFSPPYLFKGPRPRIQAAPDQIRYGQQFNVTTPDAAHIAKASLVRLSSVTHSFNANQRINFLAATAGAGLVTLTAPANANICPPGHYLLFLLNDAGIPSVGTIVQVAGQPAAPKRIAVQLFDPVKKNNAIIANAKRPPVVVGLTATCPYGLAACWGGAYAGLKQLDGVEIVRPIADHVASVAYLYLNHDGLPDLANWPTQFARSANGSYVWRGVEVTLYGKVENDGDRLFLAADSIRPAVLLAPLQRADKIQIDQENGTPRPLPADEAAAYTNLIANAKSAPTSTVWSVTGPLKQTPSGFTLEVRMSGTPQISGRPRRIVMAPGKGRKTSSVARSPAAMAAAGARPKTIPSVPSEDLVFNGGKTIAHLTFANFFIAKSAWSASDMANIDSALAKAMSDRRLNNVMQQYFSAPIGSTFKSSTALDMPTPQAFSQGDVEALVAQLFAKGALSGFDLSSTVFNFMLPPGTVLNQDAGVSGGPAKAQDAKSATQAKRKFDPDDEVDSLHGLGGYHGSIRVNAAGSGTLAYYAIGAFSEQKGNVVNGIPAFDQPWKNVVATFYHELNEARTDADVEEANRTGNNALTGWISRQGNECGDFPMDELGQLNLPLSTIFQEVDLADGSGRVPVQFQWSNAVHGPEGPIDRPH